MSESILFDILKKSKEHKEIIGIWEYNDENGFSAGYIRDYNEELVTIQHYTKYGKSDGIIIKKIENIQSIDFEDDYSKALQYLIDHSDELYKEVNSDFELNNNENWQLEILKQLEETEHIVGVEINNSNYYSGFVKKVSESDVMLHCIGKIGEDEGMVIYKIEDISSFKINDIEDRKRAILFKWRGNS